MRRRIWRILVLPLVLLLVFLMPVVIPGIEHQRFTSPDGRYQMVVYRNRLWLGRFFGVMPGQTGDSPGRVCLYDVRENKKLESAPVEMVQMVDRVEWSATNVYIKFVADWDLPH